MQFTVNANMIANFPFSGENTTLEFMSWVETFSGPTQYKKAASKKTYYLIIVLEYECCRKKNFLKIALHSIELIYRLHKDNKYKEINGTVDWTENTSNTVYIALKTKFIELP